MIKHSSGKGITIEIPNDIYEIDKCINFINERNITEICIFINIVEYKYDISFLNNINNIENIVQFRIEGNFDNYEIINKFINLKEISYYPYEKNQILDLKHFPILKSISTSNLRMFDNLHESHVEDVFHSGKMLDYEYLGKLKNLKQLTLMGVKNFSFKKFSEMPNLKHFQITQGNITDFEGIENLPNLNSIWLFNCRSLQSIIGISKLSDLTNLWFASCPKLVDISELGTLDKLKFLALENMKRSNLEFLPTMKSANTIECLDLENCADLPHIKFLDKFPNLKTFCFWNTNVLDGDLTPCLRLKLAHTANKRHYNIKADQLPYDNENYPISRWF